MSQTLRVRVVALIRHLFASEPCHGSIVSADLVQLNSLRPDLQGQPSGQPIPVERGAPVSRRRAPRKQVFG